jgi:hypothetical protein
LGGRSRGAVKRPKDGESPRINPALQVEVVAVRISQQNVREVLSRTGPAHCTSLNIDDAAALQAVIPTTYRDGLAVMTMQAAGAGFAELAWSDPGPTPCLRCAVPLARRRQAAGGSTRSLHVSLPGQDRVPDCFPPAFPLGVCGHRCRLGALARLCCA